MHFKIQIACQKPALESVRFFVWEGLHKAGLDKKTDAMLLAVALEEVCTNIMIHSLKLDPNAYIDVEMDTSETAVVFEVTDHGKQHFDIEGYKTPTIDQVIKEKKSGSMGLILIKGIMDEIKLQMNKQGDAVYRLVKRI